MSDWSAPSLSTTWLIGGGFLSVLWLAYSFLVIQQILLGLLPLFAFAGLYLTWRLLAAIEAVADAQ